MYYCLIIFFSFNEPSTTEIYTLSLHDALPIYAALVGAVHGDDRRGLGQSVAFQDLDPRADEERRQLGRERRAAGENELHAQIGRAHVRTPVTSLSRMPSSA